ncbi:MAG: PKD domain-containing protein [Candidatus Andersenbacteria bacterium]|nr:PKD domain-containing protein [Candidatus Andersenbacteria bacterium]MBI3250770.1 PKD domain-containing protein [Candidatus Andersenbacteria bacterium]
MYRIRKSLFALLIAAVVLPGFAHAQEDTSSENKDEQQSEEPVIGITTGSSRHTFTGRRLTFDLSGSSIPENLEITEVLWDFGDGIRTTGEKVSHAYQKPGSYKVNVRLTTNRGSLEDTTEIVVFEHVVILTTDDSASPDTVRVKQQQAAENGILLVELRAQSSGPEAIIEEELTNQLLDARDAISRADLLFSWTAGSVGASAFSKFSQRIEQSQELSSGDLGVSDKGIILLSDTPFGVLAPAAQSVFDRLRPSYVIITRPQTLDLLLEPMVAEEAHQAIVSSQIAHRLLGTFSARTVRDLGITNFMSFSVDFLVNRGVPINNITLILMLPVIATILSFARQVIGIKAFGLITPAMTTLSFLVLGLEYGLIVFSVILAAGTLTRLLMKRLQLLYLPRMALVLTTVSLAILALFGIGIVTEQTTLLSFSIFPILILTLLAEEFIAVQFKSGARQAFTITAWTLALSVACYYIVSWQLMRTIIVSYPEVVLLAIPLNILLGRWTGLRLTEYIRFRKLFRYA